VDKQVILWLIINFLHFFFYNFYFLPVK
jgi:hypothetical protein